MNKNSKVLKIGISKYQRGKIVDTNEIEVVAGKGILGNRHFCGEGNNKGQITLIEKENIDYYNKKYKTEISYTDFRRNIVTEGIRLNDLIKKEIEIGKIKILPYELCKPCLHLEEMIGRKNIIKEFLRKGGLRCEVLISGKIKVGDNIKVL